MIFKPLYGKVEIQLQTESQYESDKYGETNSHGLMDNKEIPKFPLPKTYTLDKCSSNNYELIDSNGQNISIPKNDLYEAIDSENNHFFFIKKYVDKYIRLVELYTAKKGEVRYSSIEDISTVELFSSLENYKAVSLELPNGSSNPSVSIRRDAFKKYFSELNNKSQAVLNILFHHSGSHSTDWNTSRIINFISNYQISNTLDESLRI